LQMTRQLRYDLVVTDLEMPELGGFDLIVHLRKDERFKTTPIVIITSRATPEHRRRARDLGVRALVAKPITRRKLLEALAARGERRSAWPARTWPIARGSMATACDPAPGSTGTPAGA